MIGLHGRRTISHNSSLPAQINLSPAVKYAKHDSAATFLIFLPSASIIAAAELSGPERSRPLIGLVQLKLNWPQQGVMRTVL